MRKLAPEQRITLRRIQTLMEYWQIEPHEIEAATPYVAPILPQPDPDYVKYRHPLHGATWNGHGQQPQWLKDALLKEGYRVEELRPDHQSQASQGQATDERQLDLGSVRSLA